MAGEVEELFARFFEDSGRTVARAAKRDGVEYWEHAETEHERAIEAMVLELARAVERKVLARGLVACARLAHPLALAAGAVEAADWGLGVFDDNGHDPTSMAQIEVLEAWITDPSEATLAAVKRKIDQARQLQIWDEDVRPPPGEGWAYIVEVTDLMLRFAVQSDDGLPNGTLPFRWPAAYAGARSVVCAHKVLVTPDRSAAASARELVQSLRASF
jgi:hypothetical protein